MTLTEADRGFIREYLYRPGFGKEELQAACPTLPNAPAQLTALQAAEDRTLAAFTLFRADMETAFNIPANAASLALAKKVYIAYIVWKMGNM